MDNLRFFTRKDKWTKADWAAHKEHLVSIYAATDKGGAARCVESLRRQGIKDPPSEHRIRKRMNKMWLQDVQQAKELSIGSTASDSVKGFRTSTTPTALSPHSPTLDNIHTGSSFATAFHTEMQNKFGEEWNQFQSRQLPGSSVLPCTNAHPNHDSYDSAARAMSRPLGVLEARFYNEMTSPYMSLDASAANTHSPLKRKASIDNLPTEYLWKRPRNAPSPIFESHLQTPHDFPTPPTPLPPRAKTPPRPDPMDYEMADEPTDLQLDVLYDLPRAPTLKTRFSGGSGSDTPKPDLTHRYSMLSNHSTASFTAFKKSGLQGSPKRRVSRTDTAMSTLPSAVYQDAGDMEGGIWGFASVQAVHRWSVVSNPRSSGVAGG